MEIEVFVIIHKSGYVVKVISNETAAKNFLHLLTAVHSKDKDNYYISRHSVFRDWIAG